MKILLTNDDGYNAEGLLRLKEKLSKFGQVIVVAPFTHMSGKSVSITIGEWQKVDKIAEDVYAIHGTPADCASWALFGLKEDFDLVVSGCNDGHNLSFDVLFSGTLGACFVSMIGRKKAIAFSGPYGDYQVLEDQFDNIWEFINDNDLLSEEYTLSVNLPKEESKGIKLSRLGFRNDYYYYDEQDGLYFAKRNIPEPNTMPEEDESRLVKEGYITITPVSRIPFDEQLFQRLKKKVK